MCAVNAGEMPNPSVQDGASRIVDTQVTRYQYSKMGFAYLKFVIVDLLPDGHEDFWEQESGEVVWHSYYPSLAERTAFHETLAGKKYDGWPLLTLSPAGGQDLSKGTVCRTSQGLLEEEPAADSGSTVLVLSAGGGGLIAGKPW